MIITPFLNFYFLAGQKNQVFDSNLPKQVNYPAAELRGIKNQKLIALGADT
jgi:hypothetical protein